MFICNQEGVRPMLKPINQMSWLEVDALDRSPSVPQSSMAVTCLWALTT